MTDQEFSKTHEAARMMMIDQLKHAVFDVRADAKAGLTDWWSKTMDKALLDQLNVDSPPIHLEPRSVPDYNRD